MPETAAASGLPPTANRFLPKVVLFQMNHTMITAATAQRMMVGKPLIFGMIMFGIADSIAPKDTPFVAYVTSPKITSMFAIVEINGCILNFAVKKPAIVVKNVHRTTQASSPRITLPATGNSGKVKHMSENGTGVDALVHYDGGCRHTHTNHTSDRKVGTCQEDQSGNTERQEHTRRCLLQDVQHVVVGKQRCVLDDRGDDTQRDKDDQNRNIQTVLQLGMSVR